MILKIAFRNLFRQKRRSLLTMLTMAGGFVLCSLSIGVADGTYSSLIDMFTRDHTGHVQVHKRGYLDKPSLYRTIDRPGAVGEKIATLSGVEAWAPRVFSPALAAVGDKTSGAQIVGIRPSQEARTTRLKHKVSAGTFLSDAPKREVMLGYGLAKILKAGVGDELVLITQAADGSIANDLFQITGIVGEKGDARERMTCYMHIETAQRFLALGSRVHEIAVVLADQRASETAAQKIQRMLGDPSLEAAPWQEIERQFYQAMQADLQGMWLSLGIIMLIVGIGVLNTVLMTILERTREFGVLRALGTRPGGVFRLIVSETACLSAAGILVGAAGGLVGNYLLSVHGMTYPTPIEYGGFTFDRMIGSVSFRSVWIPSAVTFGTAVIVSLFPALRAARIEPVRAMRAY